MPSKLAKRQLHQAVSAYEREGVVVGLVRNRTATTYGIQLDFSNAPVPDRRFSADAAWVIVGSDVVRVLMGQFKGAGPKLEHVIVVRMPFSGVRMFVESMVGVSKTGHQFLTKVNNPASPEVDRASIETSQTFTLDANLIIAGYSGREACLDLYHSSAQARVAVKRGSNEYRAEPVVRVTLTTRLLMDLHDELAGIVNELPKDESEEIEVEAEYE